MRSFRRETGLYLLALLIGLTVRLVGLGDRPLSDLEAGWALQALNLVKGIPVALGSQPAYVALTTALFFIFGGSTNALARLVPALTGSALILVPALFKERLKPRPAVIMAFALALEPGLAALSRQAGSPILAVTFTLAAWGLWEKRRFNWAGACAGLALLSGPALWVGLLGLALVWALMRPFARGAAREAKSEPASSLRLVSSPWSKAAAYGLGTIVIVGTLFMLVPGGLSAWASSLPEYLAGWARPSGISIDMMLSSLVAYQPLGVLLALIAAIRGWANGHQRARVLSLWMLIALLLAIFYPSRQVADLAWMLVPLWALASLELAHQMNVRPEERREILGVILVSVIVLIFVWLEFLQFSRPGLPPEQAPQRTLLLVGVLFLLVIGLLLVALGWSIRTALFGSAWSLVVILGVYSLGVLLAATGHRNVPNAAEMWDPGPQLPMANLLLSTVQQQSDWSDRDINAQPVTIAGVDSPALLWLLRDRTVDVRASAASTADAPMVITPDAQSTPLVSAYRGQSFVWRSTPAWKLWNFWQWLPFHESAHETEKVILWVRNDLFADARPR